MSLVIIINVQYSNTSSLISGYFIVFGSLMESWFKITITVIIIFY